MRGDSLPAARRVIKELRQIRFPKATLVVSIVRDGETLFPRAAARLEAGDQALLLTGRGGEAEVRAFLARPEATAGRDRACQPDGRTPAAGGHRVGATLCEIGRPRGAGGADVTAGRRKRAC